MNVAVDELKWPQGADCTAVPYSMFTDRRVYDLEQERLYHGPTWNYLCLENEVAANGDFKSTFIGDTPVVVTRAHTGEVAAWVNRCAHRGAQVCRKLRGNSADGTHTCVYHQWSFDGKGHLLGVPFQRGLGGHGGMPADFDKTQHNLQPVRVTNHCGVIFGTFDDDTPGIGNYLGASVDTHFRRIFNRPVEVIGHSRQYIRGNWKIYTENIKDPYHASLLHLFHMTFGLYRSSQQGGVCNNGWHSVLHATAGTDSKAAMAETKDAHLRTYQESGFTLQDRSLLAGRQEFDDGITLVILSAFPSLVVQQIQNTLACRQILPKAPGEFELVWTFFGYADDDDDLRDIRLKQQNLIGPAGLISMEDGEAVELVQNAVVRDGEKTSVILMDGRATDSGDHLVTEASIRSLWKSYKKQMDM